MADTNDNRPVNAFRATAQPSSLHADVQDLKKIIAEDRFTEAASKNKVSLQALIALSNEVDSKNEGTRPTFNFIVSKDPLTLKVANRIHEPLKRMGFDPTLIFQTYAFPREYKHPQLQEYAEQTMLFNRVIIEQMDRSVGHRGLLYTPGTLKNIGGVKVMDNIDSLNDVGITSYISSQDKNVGVSFLFRLYEKIGQDFIDLFHNDQGEWGTHERLTKFRTDDNDDGIRKSILANIHPSLRDHGVIPPFWTMLRMLHLMEELDIDYENKTSEEIADICLENGVHPYLTGMVHHVAEEFDQGDIILPGQNYVPVDLNKSMWENYFAMEDYMVDSILATAAAYKLGVDLKGTPQNLNNPDIQYHSYPGRDSTPPNTLPNRKEIKTRDASALDEFERLGGTLTTRDFFERLVFGDPDNNQTGYVVPGTSEETELHQKLDNIYDDLDIIHKHRKNTNHTGQDNDAESYEVG